VSKEQIAVYGASGYTGRQVAAEIERRGGTPVLMGRDAGKLGRVAAELSNATVRPSPLDGDDAARRAAVDGCAALINCAGPFHATARPLADAAIEVGAHYLDVTAEQEAVWSLFEHCDQPAREAGVAVVPAMAFYGGLPDLLASATAAGLASVEDVAVAYDIRGWLLTEGSRNTVAVMRDHRVTWRDGRRELLTGDPTLGEFDYPEPIGRAGVVEDYPVPEALTIPRHVATPRVRVMMSLSTLQDVLSPEAPAPDAVDDGDRAGSQFTIVVSVTGEGETRRAVATGSDIYGISAPIVVAAAFELIAGSSSGALAPAHAVEAEAFLAGLGDSGLSISGLRDCARG